MTSTDEADGKTGDERRHFYGHFVRPTLYCVGVHENHQNDLSSFNQNDLAINVFDISVYEVSKEPFLSLVKLWPEVDRNPWMPHSCLVVSIEAQRRIQL